MLICIYGDDTFRAREKVRQMQDAFREKFDPSGLNTTIFPEEGKTTIEVGAALQAMCSAPFLAPKRLVILKDLLSSWKKADVTVWKEGVSHVPESSIVIFWETAEPAVIEKNILFQELQKQGQVHGYSFPKLKEVALEKWVRERIKLLGGTMENHALRLLVEYSGADLWRLQTELEKLVAYAEGQEITEEMVREMVPASFEEHVFAFIDAVSQKDGKRILELLREERWAGTSDHYLLSMLTRQIRLLLGARALFEKHQGRISKDQLKDGLSVHPFVAQKLLFQLKGFSLDVLREAHGVLYHYDRFIKSGQLDAELAVDLFLTRLSQ